MDSRTLLKTRFCLFTASRIARTLRALEVGSWRSVTEKLAGDRIERSNEEHLSPSTPQWIRAPEAFRRPASRTQPPASAASAPHRQAIQQQRRALGLARQRREVGGF